MRDVPNLDGSNMNDRLNSHVGENDEAIDTDPYSSETIEHDCDLASGIRGAEQGVEDR